VGRRWFKDDDLGGQIAKQWNLPAYLTNAIANHHSDSEDGRSVDPGVRIASYIELDSEFQSLDTVFEVAQNDYDLDRSVMDQIVARSLDEAKEFAGKIL